MIIPTFLCHEISHAFSCSTRIFRALRSSISLVRCSRVFSIRRKIKKDPQKRLNFLGVLLIINFWLSIVHYLGRFHPSSSLSEATLFYFSLLIRCQANSSKRVNKNKCRKIWEKCKEKCSNICIKRKIVTQWSGDFINITICLISQVLRLLKFLSGMNKSLLILWVGKL